VSCAKTAELIKMSFGMWNGMNPRKHVLDGGCRFATPGEYDWTVRACVHRITSTICFGALKCTTWKCKTWN